MAVNSNPPVLLDPSMDEPHKVSFINQNFLNLANSLNPFLLSDGTNNRLLIGKDSAGSYVVKISNPGYDAFSASDVNLAFNSSQNNVRIVDSGTYTMTIGAATYARGVNMGSHSIAHGLGFPPATIVYVNTPNTGAFGGNILVNAPAYTYVDTGTNVFPGTVAYAAVDSTNLTLSVNNIYTNTTLGSPLNWVFRYYILQQAAS